jgi:hypothetical protein
MIMHDHYRRDHVPASTVMAAEYLIGENDPERLRAWIANHTPRERFAIKLWASQKPITLNARISIKEGGS